MRQKGLVATVPLINIVSRYKVEEDWLQRRMPELRSALKQLIHERRPKLETTDILVRLLYSPYRDPDPDQAAFELIADTCPDEEFEGMADEVCQAICDLLIGMKFTDGRRWEVWVRFDRGSWKAVNNDKIVEFVPIEPRAQTA